MAIEARVHSQALGDGQDDLPMSDGQADFRGNVQRRQQRPLLLADRCRLEVLLRAVGCINFVEFRSALGRRGRFPRCAEGQIPPAGGRCNF